MILTSASLFISLHLLKELSLCFHMLSILYRFLHGLNHSSAYFRSSGTVPWRRHLGPWSALRGGSSPGGLRRLGLNRRTRGEGPWTAARRVEPSVPENRERAGREHRPAALDPREFEDRGSVEFFERLGNHP